MTSESFSKHKNNSPWRKTSCGFSNHPVAASAPDNATVPLYSPGPTFHFDLCNQKKNKKFKEGKWTYSDGGIVDAGSPVVYHPCIDEGSVLQLKANGRCPFIGARRKPCPHTPHIRRLTVFFTVIPRSAFILSKMLFFSAKSDFKAASS